MSLPTTTVAIALSEAPGIGLPDPRYTIIHVMPDALLNIIGPTMLLRGFDSLMGLPPGPNGFMFHGAQIDAMGGSYGRLQTLAQAGQQVDNFAVYAAYGGLKDNGWQQHSGLQSNQFHGDVGYRTGDAEFHLTAHYLSSLSRAGTISPVELVAVDPTAQTNYPFGMSSERFKLDFTGRYALGDGWSATTDMYYGKSKNALTVTLGGASAFACANDAALLCLTPSSAPVSMPFMSTDGQQFKNVLQGTDNIYAYQNHPSTETTSWGGAVGLAHRGEFLGRPNNFAAGVSYNGGRAIGNFYQLLGTMNVDGGFGTTLGTTNNPGIEGGVPQKAAGDVHYVDAYAADAIDVTDKLKIALAGHLTYSSITQTDLMGTAPSIDGVVNNFTHFAPSIGATYAFTPGFIAYGGYSSQAHPQSPLGINCDKPELACLSMPPWFTANNIHALSTTDYYQFGFRGQLPTIETPIAPVQIAWNASLYRNDTSHYSLNEKGDDVGNVREQGFKAAVEISAGRLTAYASYKYTDARFLSTTTLGNGVNAGRDTVTNTMTITPGKVVPNQPNHTIKIGGKFDVTPQWSIGATLRGVSSSYYFGDEINYYPKIPGYFVASFNTNYRYNDRLEFFGIVENAFNTQYAVLGALVVVDKNKLAQAPGASDPRAWMLGQPLSVHGGFRYKF